jgi:Helix-turn-helix domain
MSIAVMNWVWANSPTSGNERLVLLALADACSRDDGTGCWPSAATIARKANISDRTVRRVIARLEADGHLVVHRGGGRAGSTNSYTVVTGIHTPGQNDTPDNLSRGDTGDTPPQTQSRQGTPDTAVSPDPPENYQRTTPAQPRETSPDATVAGGRVGEFFAALGNAWRLTVAQRARLAPAVEATLDLGWTPQTLASAIGTNTTGVRNAYAVLAARLSPAELPAPSMRSTRPPWCGECDEVTRMLDYHGDAPRPCPRCKAPRLGTPGRLSAAYASGDCAPVSANEREGTPSGHTGGLRSRIPGWPVDLAGGT